MGFLVYILYTLIPYSVLVEVSLYRNNLRTGEASSLQQMQEKGIHLSALRTRGC